MSFNKRSRGKLSGRNLRNLCAYTIYCFPGRQYRDFLASSSSWPVVGRSRSSPPAARLQIENARSRSSFDRPTDRPRSSDRPPSPPSPLFPRSQFRNGRARDRDAPTRTAQESTPIMSKVCVLFILGLLMSADAYFADWTAVARHGVDREPTCVDIPANLTLCQAKKIIKPTRRILCPNFRNN